VTAATSDLAGTTAAGDMPAAVCLACGGPVDGDREWACQPCGRRYPAALVKAAGDHFDYVARLSTGETVFFHSATLRGDWVTLHRDSTGGLGPTWEQTFGVPCPRGMDVRVDAIVWVADAPWGS
jgi:hypothetical protein